MALKRQSRGATNFEVTTEHSGQYKQGRTHHPANPLSLSRHLSHLGWQGLSYCPAIEKVGTSGSHQPASVPTLGRKDILSPSLSPCRAG